MVSHRLTKDGGINYYIISLSSQNNLASKSMKFEDTHNIITPAGLEITLSFLPQSSYIWLLVVTTPLPIQDSTFSPLLSQYLLKPMTLKGAESHRLFHFSQ